MSNQLQTIIDTVRQVKGQDPLYLHEPVTVRLSPHTPPVEIWGVQVSPKGRVFLLDGIGKWDELERNDLHADEVIHSVYQRISVMFSPLINA